MQTNTGRMTCGITPGIKSYVTTMTAFIVKHLRLKSDTDTSFIEFVVQGQLQGERIEIKSDNLFMEIKI